MRVLLLALAVALSGCAYFNSFSGPPGGEKEPLIGTRSYPYSNDNLLGGESITVRIVQSDSVRPYCFLEASGIDCTFPSEYLLSFANMQGGGWRSVDHQAALGICAEALWFVPAAPRDAHQQCAIALVEMRWREALPPTKDGNQ